MIGNFKRDRSPFVLTPDMAYVINGCEKKPSEKFHDFVDLCCKGKYISYWGFSQNPEVVLETSR